MGVEAEVEKLSSSLRKEIIDCKAEPDIERSKPVIMQDLIDALTRHKMMTISVLKKTRVGNTLSKVLKTLKRHKRTSAQKEELESMIDKSEALLKQWKDAADKEAKMMKKKQPEEVDKSEGLPSSTSVYNARLKKQRKEMYKDPPVLPPAKIQIYDAMCDAPKRDKKTGELTFQCGENNDIKRLLKDFRPNRTPEEVLRGGSFGGTYYRPIVSAVTNKSYNANGVLADSVDPKWIEGLDKSMLTSSSYRTGINKFGVKCGGSLGMWESSGWISDSDPYGWFQWYCRFYQGRRCSDDTRQIQRWAKCAGPKGRFRSQLCNKILAAKTKPGDTSISPVIRQTLFHWGLEITEDVLAKHKKRVNA